MNPTQWSSLRKVSFRFFFIYFALQTQPWVWLESVPGMSFLLNYYNMAMDWVVEKSNQHLFHVREVLVPLNGSGDTSYGWAQLWLFLLVSLTGCLIWTLLDRNRKHYQPLDYWLRTTIRYFIILILMSYGIIKLFLGQMVFPSLSQLATPLGDFLPMRFSWLFIGYSDQYQFFSGLMEVTAGLLMLYRRTLTLGLMLAFGVFMNVMMLNLSYDIPVKIFSIQMTFACLYLLLNNIKPLLAFFVLNKSTQPDTSYHFAYTKKWQRWGRILLKTVFIIFTLIMPLYNEWNNWQEESQKKPEKLVIPSGVYEVQSFVRNNDTITYADTLRWRDMIFEKGTYGSINTTDTLFRRRYNRAYFGYTPDTLKHTLGIKKTTSDSTFLFTMHYTLPDTNTVLLRTKLRKDSLFIVLKKTKRHFQLTERQFHWLSERNR